MAGILEQFAYGNVNTSPSLADNAEYKRALKRVLDCERELLEVLNEHEKKALETFAEAKSKLSDLCEVAGFVHGYRLGVLMTMDVFDGVKDLTWG